MILANDIIKTRCVQSIYLQIVLVILVIFNKFTSSAKDTGNCVIGRTAISSRAVFRLEQTKNKMHER